MKLQKTSIKFVIVDKSCIFVDEISYLIDMILLFVIIIALLLVVLFLRGEGSSYGKGNVRNDDKKSFSISDKNFFL